MATYEPYMKTMLWTCTSCGFVREGGQPNMECPTCETYKAGFIDIPQHIEQHVRETYPDVPPNHRDCRKLRLERMSEEGVRSKNRASGRVLPSASGNHMDPNETF